MGKASKSSGKLTQSQLTISSTSDIKAHHVLGYKLRVLLHDLRSIAKDPLAEKRTLQSTDELYLGPPYFTPEESALVKGAKITQATTDQNTVQDAIHAQMQNFFDKRRASGDARPCGPHDLAPIYLRVFEVTSEELDDAKFLSRMSRSGLGETSSPALGSCADSEGKQKTKSKGKNKGKGKEKTKGN